MKYKSVLVALSLMVFSIESQASTVEVAQWLPWKFVEQELQNLPLNFMLQPRDVTLQWQDWHPQFKGASLEIGGTWAQLQVQPTGVVAEAHSLSVLLKVQQLVIDQTIVKEIGGNRIEIQVKATCEPFEIKVPAVDFLLQATYQRENAMWSPHISQLKLKVYDGWSVTPLICNGPQGFEQVLTGLVQDSLKNPESVSILLQNFLTTMIEEKWSHFWNQITTVGYQNLKVLSMDDPGEFGFFIRGEIQSGTDPLRIPLPQGLQASLNTASPQLVLTSEGFATLAKEKALNFSIAKFNLQSLDSFKKLMRSRFLQFFLWPDLMKFSKTAPFWLTSDPSQKVDIQALGQGKWLLQMHTVGVIEAPREKILQPYLHWGLGASYSLSTQVKDSLLKLSVEQAKTKMTWIFDGDYVKQFKPSQRISSSILKKVGDSLFQGRTFEVQLPVFILKDRILKLNNWNEHEGLIWLDWK